jgi:hypothetical protein
MKEGTEIGSVIVGHPHRIGAIGVHDVQIQLTWLDQILGQQGFIVSLRLLIRWIGAAVDLFSFHRERRMPRRHSRRDASGVARPCRRHSSSTAPKSPSRTECEYDLLASGDTVARHRSRRIRETGQSAFEVRKKDVEVLVNGPRRSRVNSPAWADTRGFQMRGCIEKALAVLQKVSAGRATFPRAHSLHGAAINAHDVDLIARPTLSRRLKDQVLASNAK